MQVEAEFTDVMAAYADPAPLLEAFRAAARKAIADGANVIVPGEGPLNVFLADQGVSRVDDVPVLDSLGDLPRGWPSCGRAVHAATGLRPGPDRVLRRATARAR